MTNKQIKQAIENIEEILNSPINNDETLDYELTSFDLDWLETAKEALKNMANHKRRLNKKV